MKPPITPGEILLEEYLTPMGISQNAMARAIGVPPRAINEIVLGHRAIKPVMSIRIGAFFGQTPEFWHGLQVECDFRALGKKQKQLTAKIRPAQTLGHAACPTLPVKSSHMTPFRLPTPAAPALRTTATSAVSNTSRRHRSP